MGKRTNKTSTKVDMPGFLDAPAKGQANQLGNTADWLRQNPYQGLWNAGPNKQQQTGLDWSTSAANDLMSGGGGQALHDLGMATARGDYLDLENNPVFAEYLQSGIADPISKVYSERLRPQLEGQNVLNNSFDNLRYGLEKAKMTTDEADMVRQASADATMGLYEAERGRQMQADQLLNAAAAQMMLPGTMMSAVGQGQRDLDQSRIDSDLANRYGGLTEQDRIIMSLLPMMQAYAGQQVASPGVNRGASGIQGMIGGASAGSSMGGIGAILGGLLGGAGGYFS